VEDNGVGLGKDAEEVSEGLGLVGIRERASLLGGKVEFESWPDQGTKVAIQLPTKPPETDEDAP
jgi:two-component system sensor histidine kinase DegS